MAYKLSKELILESIDLIDDSELIAVWNEYCEAIGSLDTDEILENTQDGLFQKFGYSTTPLQDLSQAIHFGTYNYMDEYFTLDGYGNMLSVNKYGLKDVIDIDELVEFIEDNQESLVLFDSAIADFIQNIDSK